MFSIQKNVKIFRLTQVFVGQRDHCSYSKMPKLSTETRHILCKDQSECHLVLNVCVDISRSKHDGTTM